MKKLMIIGVMLGFSAMVFAQPREIMTAKESALLATNKMKTEGLISEAQFDEVYEINLRSAEEKRQIRDDMKTKMGEYRNQLNQVEIDRMNAYQEVLDKDQVREIEIAKAKKKARNMKRGKMKIERNRSRFDQNVPRARQDRPIPCKR